MYPFIRGSHFPIMTTIYSISHSSQAATILYCRMPMLIGRGVDGVHMFLIISCSLSNNKSNLEDKICNVVYSPLFQPVVFETNKSSVSQTEQVINSGMISDYYVCMFFFGCLL